MQDRQAQRDADQSGGRVAANLIGDGDSNSSVGRDAADVIVSLDGGGGGEAQEVRVVVRT